MILCPSRSFKSRRKSDTRRNRTARSRSTWNAWRSSVPMPKLISGNSNSYRSVSVSGRHAERCLNRQTRWWADRQSDPGRPTVSRQADDRHADRQTPGQTTTVGFLHTSWQSFVVSRRMTVGRSWWTLKAPKSVPWRMKIHSVSRNGRMTSSPVNR